jgi:hypothetical protein
VTKARGDPFLDAFFVRGLGGELQFSGGYLEELADLALNSGEPFRVLEVVLMPASCLRSRPLWCQDRG